MDEESCFGRRCGLCLVVGFVIGRVLRLVETLVEMGLGWLSEIERVYVAPVLAAEAAVLPSETAEGDTDRSRRSGSQLGIAQTQVSESSVPPRVRTWEEERPALPGTQGRRSAILDPWATPEASCYP